LAARARDSRSNTRRPEAWLVLATVLQHADFEQAATGEVFPEPTATLRPRGGIPVRLCRRAEAAATPQGVSSDISYQILTRCSSGR
jgi:hypothetical protein